MAKSFLAAQIEEIRGGLRGMAKDLGRISEVNRQVLSRGVGVMAPGGGNGGGGGPVLVDPSGNPIAPVGSSGPRVPGAGGIADFLRALEADKNGRLSRVEGSGPGGGRIGAPASPQEKIIMDTLGEGIEYVRKLAKAAAWAKIPMNVILRSPKSERDALIAAWEESGTVGSDSAGGGDHGKISPRPGWHQDENGHWRMDEIKVVTITSGDPTLGRGGGGGGSPLRHQGGGGAPQLNSNPFASAAKMSSAPTAGDKMVVGAVEGVTKAIDKLTAKLDTGGSLAFRTKGL